MLQQPALEAWHDSVGAVYRARINFTGVFVATDLSWRAQVEALGEGKLDADSHRLLCVAAFTTHVLRSFVTAMLDRTGQNNEKDAVPFRRVQLSDNLEAQLVRSVCDAWHVKPLIPSLLALKQAMTLRLSRIREVASQEVILGDTGRKERLGALTYIHLHFLQAAAYAVECFDDLVGEPGSKWALLCDELELAPEWIQDELVKSLRSTDDRFLFKLAMSPFTPSGELLETALAPQSGQDMEVIPLWYAEKRDGYPFCEALWTGLLKSRGLESKKAKEILGPSLFETPPGQWAGHKTAYHSGSPLQRRFIDLAKKDRSFRRYLADKDIDLARLQELPSDQRAADLRKIAPLIVVREFYRAEDSEKATVAREERSRKTSVLYSGAESLFAVSEGNPRWFIAIAGNILDRWQDYNKQIKRKTQGDEIWKAAQRFSALLRTIPALPMGPRRRGLLSLLNAAGDFFHAEVVKGEFKPEPYATFVPDSHSSNLILDTLQLALNSGAIVYVPDDTSQLILTSLRGKRFRISYLLAPLYLNPA
jgi:hypothetical protein